jgi:heme oxygenase (biliverdin-IX-beta and delta-forming)
MDMVTATPGGGRRKGAGDALIHLRDVTGPAHRALEGGLGLLNEHLSLDEYTAVLTRFYGFWSGWQPQIADLIQNDLLLTPRRRLHLLAADLAALGVSEHELAALPKCPLTALRDAAEALGSLYVMEGSTLGGRLIRENVQRCLGSVAVSSCSYFNSYGTATNTMWRSFLVVLDAAPSADQPRIGYGAVATFERLGWWLTRITP